MASQKKKYNDRYCAGDAASANLNENIFFGINLDSEQRVFRDLIYDSEKKIVFCEAVAGTGKTTVSVATSVLMCQQGKFDDIVYVMHSVGDAQGYLPGDLSQKSAVWFEGLYQALIMSNLQPSAVINTESMVNQKNGTGFVTALTDTYLRGSNIGAGNTKTILIIDEAQNFPEHNLRKVLSRACENTKVIVIGHSGQIDLYHPQQSAFRRCMEHFRRKNDPRVGYAELKTNHRGFVSSVADEPW